MDDVLLRAGALEMQISPGVGGSIARFERVEGAARESILRGSARPGSALEAGCFPLVPYANRIRDGRFTFRGEEVRIAPNMAGDPSPLHGFGWLVPWSIEQAGPDHATLSHVYEPGEWPWRYRAEQHFSLDIAGATISLTCRNLADTPMPCGLGFHPYWPCDPATRIETQVARVWTIDEQVLPTGVEPAVGRYALDGNPLCGRDLDHGYDGWSGTMLLHYPGRGFDTRMASPTARFFQLYSPVDGGFVAAEPVGHRNAALNEPEAQWPEAGLQVLAPGEGAKLDMRIDLVPQLGLTAV
jgi:aldose 1-epimerase